MFHSIAMTFSLQHLRHNTTTALTRSRGGGCCFHLLPPPHTIQHVPDIIHHSRQLTRLNCNTTDPWTTTWNSCVSFFAVSNTPSSRLTQGCCGTVLFFTRLTLQPTHRHRKTTHLSARSAHDGSMLWNSLLLTTWQRDDLIR